MDRIITYCIPAGMNRTDDILNLDARLKSMRKDVRIVAYDSLQGLAWTGGRLTFNRDFVSDGSKDASCLSVEDVSLAIQRAKRLNDAGIPFHLVFNSTLESVDVQDEDGNRLLEALHHEMNGITVASESLRNHISIHFPKYELTASICHAYTRTEQYHTACQRHHRVVAMPILAYRPELMDGLPVEKLVFIINDECFPFCTRKQHYDNISRCSQFGNLSVHEQQLNYQKGQCLKNQPGFKQQALKAHDPEFIARVKRTMIEHHHADGIAPNDLEAYFTLTPTMRRELMRQGVRTFKLQGREYPPLVFRERVLDFVEKVVRQDF